MKDWIIKFVVLVLLLSFVSHPLAAEVIYYDTNNVGTPVAMWDSTGGKVWEATYYPFGTEYQTPTNIWENTRKFAGKEKDKETDLSYFGARYYDDLSGRFLTPDPVQPVDALTSKTNAEMLNNPQRFNRYAYGLNNPYRYIDPDGRDPKDPWTGETNQVTRCHIETHNNPEKELFGVSIMATAASGAAVEAVAGRVIAGLAGRLASKGWSRLPKSIQDQMTLDAAENGAGRKIIDNLGDARFKGMEKWEYKVKSANGRDSVIHYVRDPKTEELLDFKFKKHSTDSIKPWGNDHAVPPGD